MDGYETLSRIKQDDDLRHIPVIMISAVDEMDSVLKCIDVYYTSDTPLAPNETLAASLSAGEGLPPVYAITRAILRRILAGEAETENRRVES